MSPLDLSQLFTPSHWFDGDPGSPSAYYLLLVIFFAALAVAGGVIYWYLRPRRFAANALHSRMAEVSGVAGVSLGLLGLFLLLMRYLTVTILSARLLLYLTLLAVLVLAGYAIYFYVKRYPAMLADQKRDEERKRFMPKPKDKARATPATPGAPAKKKAKKKKR
jgi:hypothetical protein